MNDFSLHKCALTDLKQLQKSVLRHLLRPINILIQRRILKNMLISHLTKNNFPRNLELIFSK